MICAAKIPALVAPGLPMATVATGIPAGIWTVARRESMPCKEVEGIGTPITGRVVCAAITPARWAAPPAPAMITRMPRPAALRAYSAVRSGERCAEVTAISYAMPNSSRALPASRMISRSESLPMTIETSDLLMFDESSPVLLLLRSCVQHKLQVSERYAQSHAGCDQRHHLHCSYTLGAVGAHKRGEGQDGSEQRKEKQAFLHFAYLDGVAYRFRARAAMSLRKWTPSNPMVDTAWYAALTALGRSAARAVTPSTRPPEV